MTLRGYLLNVGDGLSVLANYIRGGQKREPLCSAFYRSFIDYGWASKIAWPWFVINHCERSWSRWQATQRKQF